MVIKIFCDNPSKSGVFERSKSVKRSNHLYIYTANIEKVLFNGINCNIKAEIDKRILTISIFILNEI